MALRVACCLLDPPLRLYLRVRERPSRLLGRISGYKALVVPSGGVAHLVDEGL